MVFLQFVRSSLVSAIVKLCVSQHNQMFRRSWYSRERFISGCNGGREASLSHERQSARDQAKWAWPPRRVAGSSAVKYQGGRGAVPWLVSRWCSWRALLSCHAALQPLCQQQPRCIFQPLESTFCCKERLVQGSHGNCTLCFFPQHRGASAVVRRSCPRGPSAEWFTSVAQKPFFFRVLLLQIVFSSVG